MRFTPPKNLVYPPDLEDSRVYQKVKDYCLEAIMDLLTDESSGRGFSDSERVRIYEEFLALNRLPEKIAIEGRIALALSELRVMGENYQILTDRWFRRRTFLPGEPGYVYQH